MEKSEHYTGYAVSSGDGTLTAVASYKEVGMYQPCVYLEDGILSGMTLGGFDRAPLTPASGDGKRHSVLISRRASPGASR